MAARRLAIQWSRQRATIWVCQHFRGQAGKSSDDQRAGPSSGDLSSGSCIDRQLVRNSRSVSFLRFERGHVADQKDARCQPVGQDAGRAPGGVVVPKCRFSERRDRSFANSEESGKDHLVDGIGGSRVQVGGQRYLPRDTVVAFLGNTVHVDRFRCAQPHPRPEGWRIPRGSSHLNGLRFAACRTARLHGWSVPPGFRFLRMDVPLWG